MNSRREYAARKSGTTRLDPVTVEAVLAFRAAAIRMRKLNRAGTILMPPARRAEHTKKLVAATTAYDDAIEGLEAILVGDEA